MVKVMVQVVDLGINIQCFYQYEFYFWINGCKGECLSSVDLECLYQNMLVWLWNKIEYCYENDKDDELGFKMFIEFLNCYVNNVYSEGMQCFVDLKKLFVDNNMIYGDGSSKVGMMNLSYLFNYMEKLLMCLMLGCFWWDLNIKVDVEKYLGVVLVEGEKVIESISLYLNLIKWFVGNMQFIGLWVLVQKEVIIEFIVLVFVIVIVVLVDDLIGCEKYEVVLNCLLKVMKIYDLKVNDKVIFKVFYGGLIYIKGNSLKNELVEFIFIGVVKVLFYKDGEWKNVLNFFVLLGELELDVFVYIMLKKNFEVSNFIGGVVEFVNDLDIFVSLMNDFYGCDGESGKYWMFIYKVLMGYKYCFVNDVQIFIGDVYLGYLVMNSSFLMNSIMLLMMLLNDWLIWYEVGYNVVEILLNVLGVIEVVNNVLVLYMQDCYFGKMNCVVDDIIVVLEYLDESNGQVWVCGGVGDCLLMYV